jgi:hypothetical protein
MEEVAVVNMIQATRVREVLLYFADLTEAVAAVNMRAETRVQLHFAKLTGVAIAADVMAVTKVHKELLYFA